MSQSRLFTPPLLNSASLWASTPDEVRALYACASTGAITTRTALLDGFAHDPSMHQHAFFSPSKPHGPPAADGPVSSLNTLGYSPHGLGAYMDAVREAERSALAAGARTKPVIFSVTGTPAEVARCFGQLAATRPARETWMEVNLSCPNIAGKPPPAYSRAELGAYVAALAACVPISADLPVGLKVPPYTHAGQFADLVGALADAAGEAGCPVAFLTAVNTLGSCLLLAPGAEPVLDTPGGGVGGMAGASLHPLALGNVRTLRRLLDADGRLRAVRIIGVGGVSGPETYRSMLAAGADAVGVATALGARGVGVFAEILQGTR